MFIWFSVFSLSMFQFSPVIIFINISASVCPSLPPHVSCPCLMSMVMLWPCFVKSLQSYLCFSRFLLCVSRASCLSSPDCVHLCVVSLLCLTLISLQSVYTLLCRLCMFLVLLSCVRSFGFGNCF